MFLISGKSERKEQISASFTGCEQGQRGPCRFTDKRGKFSLLLKVSNKLQFRLCSASRCTSTFVASLDQV